MTPQHLAELLEDLSKSITPTPWNVHNAGPMLSVRSEKPVVENANERWKKPARNVCVMATTGIAKTNRKQANAHFICLLKNNIEMIIDTLKHSTRTGHTKAFTTNSETVSISPPNEQKRLV